MAIGTSMDAPAIFILGMHRSGTSCLSGSLQERGLQLGEVVEHTWDNLKGNRENLEFRALNDAVLAYNGGKWSSPPEELRWDARLAERRDALIAERGTTGKWGFKDPRTLLTMPFWLEALPQALLVASIRHPRAVIESLSTRDGIPKHRVAGLWQQYNERLLRYSQRHDILVVSFDWPEDRYREAIDRVSAIIGLPKVDDLKEAQFFDSSLRRISAEDVEGELESELLDLYHHLLKISDSLFDR